MGQTLSGKKMCQKVTDSQKEADSQKEVDSQKEADKKRQTKSGTQKVVD